MKRLATLFCTIFSVSIAKAQNFSPLAPNVDLQFTELTKPLADELQHIRESAALIEQNGNELTFNGSRVTQNCEKLDVRWSSQKVGSKFEDKISFDCGRGEYKEIFQVREGKGLKAFKFDDWMTFDIPKLKNMTSYSLFLSWQDFKLEWRQYQDLKSLFIASIFDGENYEYIFTEKVNPRALRVYEVYDFVVEQHSFKAYDLTSYVYYSSDTNNELSPNDFSKYMQEYLKILAGTIQKAFKAPPKRSRH